MIKNIFQLMAVEKALAPMILTNHRSHVSEIELTAPAPSRGIQLPANKYAARKKRMRIQKESRKINRH